MSLLNILRKKSKVECFTTPSHSQKFFICSKLRQFYKWDISETDAHNPEEALLLAQKKASAIYKTKSTYFLTNGSSSGIIASVLSCVKKSERVLIWKNAHPSHYNAIVLAGAEPIFYDLSKNEDFDVYSSLNLKTVEEKFMEYAPKAIIVTSPSYEGIVSDIKNIKGLCEKYGVFLIVDEAHGALYPFCEKLPPSSIYQGADFVIQSLHKTAGGLNPTALLHCNCDVDVSGALSMINTTSPSYALLASIEKNINYLNSNKGREKILELVNNIEKIKKNLPEGEFFGDDITKILVKIKGFSGFELSEILFDKFKIEDERTNEKSSMLLCGIGTDSKKLFKLERALKKLIESGAKSERP